MAQELTYLDKGSPYVKARSHEAIFSGCGCGKKWVVWMLMRLFIWCDCNAFVCVMSHMNGFHTHSVQLWCTIPICIYTDCSHTMWTKCLKSQEKFSKNAVAKEISRTVWTSLKVQVFFWESISYNQILITIFLKKIKLLSDFIFF